jgi:hypothetical protein
LIPDLERFITALDLLNEWQLTTMGFELKGAPHLEAWVEADYIVSTAAGRPNRLRRSDLIDQRHRFIGQIQPQMPGFKLLRSDHKYPLLIPDYKSHFE